MEEKNIEEKEIINGESQPEVDQNLIKNDLNNNDEINNKEIINDINKKEEENIENNIEKNEILENEEEKEPILDNINNNINENINNINNINPDNNLFFQLNPPQNNMKFFNFDKNLSKEQKEEIIEKELRNLLTELSKTKEEGNNYYNNKNYEEAEKKYKEGIKKINEFQMISNIEEVNGQINDHLMNINILNSKFYNNLSTVLFKQKKYEESLKTAEFIIQNINQDHDVSYCRILYCLIELKKIILANYYADIIKKKFKNTEAFVKFNEELARLDKLNKEFSDNILNENPELKKEAISLNDDLNINKEKEEEKEDDNKIMKYAPYIIGGIAFLLIGGRYIYNKCKGN